MKRLFFILSFLLLSAGLQAQPGARAERVQAIKVGYLTERLELSSAQATGFWPVYNEYEDELRAARKAFRQKYDREGGSRTDAQASRFIEDNLDFQEQVLDIRRKYKDRFLKIITARQLATLYEAERDFRKILLQQLRKGRGRR